MLFLLLFHKDTWHQDGYFFNTSFFTYLLFRVVVSAGPRITERLFVIFKSVFFHSFATFLFINHKIESKKLKG